MKAQGLRANLIVVADHGMAAVAPERTIVLDDIADMGAVHVVFTDAVSGIDIPPTEAGAAARAKLLAPHDHLTCWNKADVPARFHYGANPRVPDLVCVAQVGWLVETRESMARRHLPLLGEHGYDNTAPEMGALFVAEGTRLQERDDDSAVRERRCLPPYDLPARHPGRAERRPPRRSATHTDDKEPGAMIKAMLISAAALLISATAWAQAPEALPPNDYSDKSNWLCWPGASDACAVDLTTTVVAADGSTKIERYAPRSAPAHRLFLCLSHGVERSRRAFDHEGGDGGDARRRPAVRAVRQEAAGSMPQCIASSP